MITQEFQGHRFECYTVAEFKAAGMKRTHRPVSNTFTPSEGQLLFRWLRFFPNAVLVCNGKQVPRITVYVATDPSGKTRARRRKTRCGAGNARMEGLSGALSDSRAFYDVLHACRRKLKEWEDAGVLPRYSLELDFEKNRERRDWRDF